MEFRRLIRLFIIMVAVIQITSAEIILEILFEDYSNPNNWLATHECCYDKLSTCRVSCDNTLSMCVSSDLNKGSCGLGSVTINPKYTFRDDEKRFLQGKDEYRFQNPFNHKLGKGIKEDKLSLDFRVVHSGTENVADFKDIEVKVDTGSPSNSWQVLGTVKTVEGRRWKRSAKKLTLKA
uniref:Uncharacterized protein n=2 Tax=Clytia hemisphaerica TaxID=252671 RepID=A0A7M5V1X6_9CNID